MTYVYEAEMELVDGDWLCTVPAFEDGGTFGGGHSVREAVSRCAQALRLAIADYLEEGSPLPPATFHEPPATVLCVEVDASFVRESACLSVKQAAQELGVTSGRVSQLLRSGGLEGVFVNSRRMVTIASVNARKACPPVPHRPRGVSRSGGEL